MFTRTRHRALLAGLVLAATAVLAGCSGSGQASTSDSASGGSGGGVSVPVAGGEVKTHDATDIAVMLQATPTYSDTLIKANGVKDAAKALGAKVTLYYSNLDPATELANYQSIVNSGKYGALIIQSVTSQLCKTIGSDALSKNMLVVVIGGPLCGDGTASGTSLRAPGTLAYIDTNNLIPGNLMMLKGAEKVLGPGPQKVLMIEGTQGHPSTNSQLTAWKQFASTVPNWKLDGTVYTDWTTPGAFSSTQNLLQSHRNATVIFTPYVDITAGVVKAIDAAGLSSKISVFETSGGTKVSVQMLQQGQILGSVPTYSHEAAYQAVQDIVDASKGKSVPAYYLIPAADKNGMLTKKTLSGFTPEG